MVAHSALGRIVHDTDMKANRFHHRPPTLTEFVDGPRQRERR